MRNAIFAKCFLAMRKREEDKEKSLAQPSPLLAELASIDVDTVIAAILLHDVLEDTPVTYDMLVHFVGQEVASIVKEVTDDTTLSSEQRKIHQLEKAEHLSIEAKLVKLADRVDNCSELELAPPLNWDAEKVTAYFKHTALLLPKLRYSGLFAGLLVFCDRGL